MSQTLTTSTFVAASMFGSVGDPCSAFLRILTTFRFFRLGRSGSVNVFLMVPVAASQMTIVESPVMPVSCFPSEDQASSRRSLRRETVCGALLFFSIFVGLSTCLYCQRATCCVSEIPVAKVLPMGDHATAP